MASKKKAIPLDGSGLEVSPKTTKNAKKSKAADWGEATDVVAEVDPSTQPLLKRPDPAEQWGQGSTAPHMPIVVGDDISETDPDADAPTIPPEAAFDPEEEDGAS